ncbi:MAG: ZIP family metal transporter [Candidatus Brennerbacteria bacterium]|nr:ZIP family metal transporter [Candidatus Brennerbacteria bacterium]
MLLTILGASLIGSVVALGGGALLLWREAWARRISLYLVSFAAGALLGAAFFDLLPEMEGLLSNGAIYASVVAGILVMLFFEKFMKWYHCHDQQTCDYHTFSSSILFGDAVHNFLDGIAIAASFLISVPIGVATTAAVFFHEVPQEIGDFGALLHAGYGRARVWWLNFTTALTTPAGALLGYFFLPFLEPLLGYFLGLAAGAFIYIAVSDLMPEIRHRAGPREFLHFFMILVGLAVIMLVGTLVPE